jgi:hypothetical protein
MRTVLTEDAVAWLKNQAIDPDSSFVTSMPDYSEFPKYTLNEWKSWFTETAALILDQTPDHGVAIFFQSDIKVDGEWIDKGYLCQKAAERTGHTLLWHKIFCRHDPGSITFGRPSYSHLLCFSKNLRANVALSTADVIPGLGEKLWPRGMGQEACEVACQMILKETQTRTVINPFCGYGSVLAVANRLGLKAIGIEMSAKRAEKARLACL